jgi:hypothetical protein
MTPQSCRWFIGVSRIRIEQNHVAAPYNRFLSTMQESLCAARDDADRKVRMRMTGKSKIRIVAFDELQTFAARYSVHPYRLSSHQHTPV